MTNGIKCEVKNLREIKKVFSHMPNKLLRLYKNTEIFIFEYPVLISGEPPYRLHLPKLARSEEDARLDISPIGPEITDIDGNLIDVKRFRLISWTKYV
jgi:hypothetical protein